MAHSQTQIIEFYLADPLYNKDAPDANGFTFYHHVALEGTFTTMRHVLEREGKTRSFTSASSNVPSPLELTIHRHTDHNGEVDTAVVKLFRSHGYKEDLDSLVTSNGACVPTYTWTERFRESIDLNSN